MASEGEQLAKKIKGEPGFQDMIQQIADAAAQSANAAWTAKTDEANEKWVQQLAAENVKWEGRTKELITEVNKHTDEKIAAAMRMSEAKSEALYEKFKKEVLADIEAVKFQECDDAATGGGNEIREEVAKLSKIVEELRKGGVKPAVGVTGGISGASNQPGMLQQIDHKINASSSNKTSFRERDPTTLKFSGKEAVDKKDAAATVTSTLLGLGIGREHYSFSGPPRGTRFWVKFKRGALQYEKPAEVAHHVKQSFKPAREGDPWRLVEFTREEDKETVKYEFGYDQASNQVIKEIIVKNIFSHIKAKSDAFKLYKRDGKIFKKFQCIARVIVGHKEDSFQVKWDVPEAFTDLGLVTDDIEKSLRIEYAKWCL